ncbi:MAG TPA: hypothetical protein VGK26_02025 [Thermoanaerobaculia bacterium]|jgi:hypothetical protein
MKTSVFLLICSVSFTLGAQVLTPPLAPDSFPVNQAQVGPPPAAKALMAPSGAITVTWDRNESLTHSRILARRFDADGNPLEDEFFVSQSAVGDQTSPAIAGDDAGDFVVVWESTLQDGSEGGIYGRRYVGGVPTSDEFLVNASETGGDQNSPSVSSASDGRFVVVWETDRPDPAGADVVGQLYDASGDPVGSQFDVAADAAGPQMRPAVAMDATGGFVVTWFGAPADAPSLDNVFARRFASDGTPAGDQFRVNTTADIDQTNPVIATDGTGRYLIVWGRATGTFPHEQLRGRYFRGSTPEGPEFAASDPFEDQIAPGLSLTATRALVAWSDEGALYVRGFDALGRPGQNFTVTSFGANAFLPSIAANALGRFVVIRLEFQETSAAILGRIGAAPDALNAFVDPPASAGIPFNGILESGEEAVFAPAYLDTSPADVALTGSLAANFGPPGSEVAVADGAADYGTLAPGSGADCLTATGDCYAVFVSRGPNVLGHWDPVFVETLSNGETKTWALHVGETFTDVAPSSLYYPFIEAAAHYAVTAGCGNLDYCSDASVSRAEMAVFLLKSRYGASHVPPPATGTVFDDVHPGDFAADWIEELAGLAITAGCDVATYCPADPVTRQQMAVFLLKTLEGSAYIPPDPIGVFGDVPTDDPFAPWIEDLVTRQITGGCQTDPLLYCPLRSTSRGEMAVFLTKAFSLVLYGP